MVCCVLFVDHRDFPFVVCVVCWSLCVFVCCMLCVACCVLFIVCWLLRVVWCLWFIVRCLFFVLFSLVVAGCLSCVDGFGLSVVVSVMCYLFV